MPGNNKDFYCTPDGNFQVTDDVKTFFNENGFIIVRQLLSKAELLALKEFVENDESFQKHRYGRDDGEGGKTKLVLWNNLSDDITGIIARSEKVAGTMEELLGGEVYHYHSKVIMKDAHTGGAHVWHQDYGYWYENGCLFPDMGTTFIAIDKADQSNGCLKILHGSHKIGRIDHKRVGDQAGADLERVEHIKKECELVHVVLEAGDCLFFHSNMLHRSDQNRSDNRRWAYLCAYNRASNNPVLEHHHPKYTYMQKVPNSEILAHKSKSFSNRGYFAGPSEDFSLDKVTEKTA